MLEETLELLLRAPGITGAEDNAANVVADMLSEYMPVRRDALGSVIGEKEGTGEGILLDAHLDQIGLIVTSVTDEGFVKVSKCGGADIRTMACHEVMILGKEQLYGVVTSTPPHLLKGEDSAPSWEDISIDVGLSGDVAKEKISIGDRVLLLGKVRKMLGNRICAPAIDDRAGIAVILRALEILKEKKSDKKITVVFSVQEEVTGGGAKGAAFQSDDATAIAVDVSFATAPDISPIVSKPLGNGPMIGISSALNLSISEKLQAIAKENDIPFSLEVMGSKTGTNAEDYAFTKCGKKTGLVSIPIRNMHTSVELCDLDDLENAAKLLALFVESEGKAE